MTDLALHALSNHLDDLSGQASIDAALQARPGRVALVSSFGTESAVLLHMAAELDPSIPVIFLDTLKLFKGTHDYKNQLVARLGLTDVRVIQPESEDLRNEDRAGALWLSNPDRCCDVRKVWPLSKALDGFDVWITGRKKFQNLDRHRANRVEIKDGRVVLSPLLQWSKADLNAYFEAHDLPHHPLEKAGYPSVGCFTCTAPVRDNGDDRSGRWQGREKTECGIHLRTLSPAA